MFQRWMLWSSLQLYSSLEEDQASAGTSSPACGCAAPALTTSRILLLLNSLSCLYRA